MSLNFKSFCENKKWTKKECPIPKILQILILKIVTIKYFEK